MNVGDVLDRLSAGQYVSPYHRASNLSGNCHRLSLPFFYDPSWNTKMVQLPLPEALLTKLDTPQRAKRWARTKITCEFPPLLANGQTPPIAVGYNQFLAKKLAKVFPALVPEELYKSIKSTSEPSTRHALVVATPNVTIPKQVRTHLQDFFKRNPNIKPSHGLNHAIAVY